RSIQTPYGGETTVRDFCKPKFCDWVCKQRDESNDFIHFEELVVPILQEFISPQVCKVDDELS
ncbi:MAG: hypothetical protein ACYTX0_25155, partial [Nostoc sp.]